MNAKVLPSLLGLRPPVLMGIVNVTPNSFSDTGEFFLPEAAVGHGRELVRDGAGILDLGAEASSFFRPGVEAVEAQEQLRRLRPVLAGLVNSTTPPPLPRLSIDTRSAAVAREAVGLGVHMINDISAGTADGAMLATAAELGVPLVLMHISEGYPATPANDDADITQRVLDFLLERAAAAIAAGVDRAHILLDPGVGFGKTMNDNWRLVLEVRRLVAAGYPVVLGASRKRFLGELAKVQSDELRGIAGELAGLQGEGGHERDGATGLVSVYAARAGVQIHRVHNVALCRRAFARAGLGG